MTLPGFFSLRLALVLDLLWLACAPLAVEGYYQPAAGRWISRDPIEGRGGLNLQAQAGNDVVGQADALGLKPRKCTLLIRVAHRTSSGPDCNRHHFDNLKEPPKGNGIGYVGCGANGFNQGVKEKFLAAAIPDMPRNSANPSDHGYTDSGVSSEDYLNSRDVAKHIDASLEAALKEARRRCAAECCSSIVIRITCDQDNARFEALNRRDQGQSTLRCNTSIRKSCRDLLQQR